MREEIATAENYNPPIEYLECEKIFDAECQGSTPLRWNYVEIWKDEQQRYYVRNFDNSQQSNPVAIRTTQEIAEKIMAADGEDVVRLATVLV